MGRQCGLEACGLFSQFDKTRQYMYVEEWEKRYTFSGARRMSWTYTSSPESMSSIPVEWESIVTRRWHSLLNEGQVGRQWQTQVRKASSLDEIASVEREMRNRLDLRRYNELVKECDRRMCYLHERGRLSAKGLCNFVQYRCWQWQTLSLAVGWGLRLVERGFLSLESMSEFLFQVSLRSERNRAYCERLQSIVDILEKNKDKMSARWLLRGVFGASRIDTLRVDSLMNEVDQLYRERLHELSSEEVMRLVLACSRFVGKRRGFNGRSLCLKFLTEYSGQLRNFPVKECVKLLSGLTFSFHGDGNIRQRLVEEFSSVEESLACAMSQKALSRLDVSRLCAALGILSYKSTALPFKNFLLQQMKTLPPRALVQIFHYVGKYDAVDGKLLECLLTCLSNMESWHATAVNLFLGTLSLQHIHGIPASQELAAVVEKEVRQRLTNSAEAFTAGQCASIFYSLVTLKINNSLALDRLFEKALGNFKELHVCELLQFLLGVSHLNCSAHVKAMREAMTKTKISHWRPTMQCSSVLCKCLVGMQLVEESWLNEIAEICRQKISSLMTSPDMIMTVNCLSLLGFHHVELFSEICKWLDEYSEEVTNTWCWNDTVDVLWSCMFQDVYPKKALAELHRLSPSSVVELPVHTQEALVQVSLLWMQISGKISLRSDTHSTLMEVLREKRGRFAVDVWRCLHGIVDILPDKHALLDVTIAEGCRLGCAILKNLHGESVEWPESSAESPSAEDIQQLVDSGLQPVAVLAVGRTWLDSEMTSLLGPAQVICRALEGCGWEVLILSTLDYKLAVDKKDFLRFQLGNVGLQSLK